MIDHEEARLSLADLLLPGLADPSRTAALRAHIAVCGACREELAELRRVDDLVRTTGPLPEPSPQLMARITALAEPGAEASGPQRAPAHARRIARALANLTFWRVATAASVVALAATLFLATRDGGFVQTGSVSLAAAPGWRASGEAVLGRAHGREVVRFEVRGLRHLPSGGYYELWLARSATQRISLGAFAARPDGRLVVTVDAPAIGPEYRGVWLTAEPDDDNPAWSNDWVVKGRLA